MIKTSSINDLWDLPEVEAMRGQMQNKWHRYDVYDHTQKVYAIILRRKPDSTNLIATAILHDIGKIPTAKISEDDEGNILYARGHPAYQFSDHAIKGRDMILEMPKNLFLSAELDQEYIAEIVGKHQIIQKHATKIRNFSTNSVDVQRNLGDLQKDFYAKENDLVRSDLLEMFYADSLGKGYPKKVELEILIYHMLQKNSCDLKSLQKLAYRMHRKYDLHEH